MTDFQHKRGTSTDHENYIGAKGEVTYNTDTNRLHVHDGVTGGGHAMALLSDAQGYQTLITDFEGDLSAWGGDTGSFTLATSPVKNAIQSLEGDGTAVGIASTSGLNTYPADGERHRIYTRLPADGRNLYTFFAQSETKRPDGYEVFFDEYTSAIELNLRSGGATTTLQSSTTTIPTGEWIYADITPDVGANTQLDVVVYDASGTQLASLTHDTSGDSASFTTGGVGCLSNNGGTSGASWFDYFGIPNGTGSSGGGGSTLVDSFEDQSISEYAGDTGSYTTVTSPVKDGTYALQGAGSGTGIGSTSGLNAYPSTGDTFRVYTQQPSDGRSLFTWCAQSAGATPDGYEVFFDVHNSNFELRRRAAGSPTTLESANATIETGAWVYAEITHTTGNDITVELFDSTATSVVTLPTHTDTTYTSGGIAFLSNTDTSVSDIYWDYVGIV